MNRELIFNIEQTSVPEFHVSLSPRTQGEFEEQLDQLVEQFHEVLQSYHFEVGQLVFAKLFVSDYINQKKLIERHEKFNSLFSNAAFSIIEQAPLDGTKINLLLFFLKTDQLRIEKREDVFHIFVAGKLHIYQAITSFDSSLQTPYSQTQDAFRRHIRHLEEQHLNLKDHCVRTWIYSRDVDKDYGGIVEARNDVFKEQGLTSETHYIASTGIEGKGLNPLSCVNVDFYSISDLSPRQVHYLQALDYLNATHEYGVAFERGTCILYPDKKHLFISGTASIDKRGDCVYRDQVLKQTERLFLNIEKLLESEAASLRDIAQMIVYLRNVSDYPVVRTYLDGRFGNTPKVVVLAGVCRPEWLIEVECFAVKRAKNSCL